MLDRNSNEQNVPIASERLKNRKENNIIKTLFFQQYEAPAHISKIVINFAEDKEREILEWLANSLDLNPI